MALASYGGPRFLDELRRHGPRHRRRRLPHRADRLAVAGQAPRLPGEEWTAEHADLAASVQLRLEEVLLELAALAARADRRPRADPGRRGRAQLRGQLPAARRGPVRRGLGAAGRRRRRDRARRRPARRRASRRARPRRCRAPTSAAAGATTSSRPGCAPRRSPTSGPPTSPTRSPRCLADDGVVAWFQGRSEYGPRALGHRSLLAHPGHEAQPGAAQRRQGPRAVPAGRADGAGRAGGGDLQRGPLPSPYMLFVHDVAPEWRDRIPAVVHVDGTARVQTVDRGRRAAGRPHARAASSGAPGCRSWSTPASTPPAGRWSTTRGTRSSASARRRSTCWRSARSSVRRAAGRDALHMTRRRAADHRRHPDRRPAEPAGAARGAPAGSSAGSDRPVVVVDDRPAGAGSLRSGRSDLLTEQLPGLRVVRVRRRRAGAGPQPRLAARPHAVGELPRRRRGARAGLVRAAPPTTSRPAPATVAGSQGRVRVPLPEDRRPTDWERGTAGLATAALDHRRHELPPRGAAAVGGSTSGSRGPTGRTPTSRCGCSSAGAQPRRGDAARSPTRSGRRTAGSACVSRRATPTTS